MPSRCALTGGTMAEPDSTACARAAPLPVHGQRLACRSGSIARSGAASSAASVARASPDSGAAPRHPSSLRSPSSGTRGSPRRQSGPEFAEAPATSLAVIVRAAKPMEEWPGSRPRAPARWPRTSRLLSLFRLISERLRSRSGSGCLPALPEASGS